VSTNATAAGPAIGGAATPKRRKARTDRARAERKLGLLLVAPAALVMAAVTAYPIGYAIWLSLQRADLRFPDEREFVGLANYGAILSSDRWWIDLFHTVALTVITVSLEFVLGMILALVMHKALVGRGIIRTTALIPYGIVTVVAAFAWRLAFSGAEGGFVPAALGLENDPLGSTVGIWITAILTEVWKTTPFMALLLLAGLALVPDELHEAAKVDGASAWQRFVSITLPLMKPAILVALLFRTLDAFRIFDTVFILSNNGVNRQVETVSVLTYNTMLTRLNLGLGSALSVLVFVCVGLIAAVYVKLLGRDAIAAGTGGK
jgi:multiple sugar transport system permease protein